MAKSNPRLTHPEWMQRTQELSFFCDVLCGVESTGHLATFLDEQQRKGVSLFANQEQVRTTAVLLWSAMKWRASGEPILRLTPDLAWALAHTEPPVLSAPLEELPKLPWDGFYIDTAGAYEIWNEHTGLHPSEGVYVSRDRVLPAEGAEEAVDGILIAGIGRDRKGGVSSVRDDAVIYSFMCAGKPLVAGGQQGPLPRGLATTVHLVYNFLTLWNAHDGLSVTVVQPHAPTSPGKQKRLHNQGRSSHRYFEIGLSKKHLRERATAEAQGEKPDTAAGEWHRVVVRGHFQRFWCLAASAGGAQVLEERTREDGKKLVCVRKYVMPHEAYRRGPARTSNVFQVRL